MFPFHYCVGALRVCPINGCYRLTSVYHSMCSLPLSCRSLMMLNCCMYSATNKVWGNGEAGYVNGPHTTAQFNYPHGIAIDSKRNCAYVCDGSNCSIRR